MKPTFYSLQPASVHGPRPTAYSLQSAARFRPQSTVHGPQPSSPGIALVMVLGILAVMVILAVAFAVSMRTERMAAGNYANGVRARQLAHVGLARALNDLALQLGTNGLNSFGGGSICPSWSATNSYYSTNYVNTATNLLAGSATNFVPRALWSAAWVADGRVQWVPIVSPVDSFTMGRVKYLILNCSGLLDANWAGGGATRGVGTNPMELALGNMPELNAATFLADRAEDRRYETLEELVTLNTAFNDQKVFNFNVYSYAPAGPWPTNQPLVNLAGDETKLLLRQGLIINAFTNSGFSLLDAGALFTNLLDYVDLDDVPRNFETSVEPVPMISKIKCASVTGSDVDKYNITVVFTLWYPFVTGGGNYSFEARVSLGGGTEVLVADPGVSLSAGQYKDVSGQLIDTAVVGPYQPVLVTAVVKKGVAELDKLKPTTTLPFAFTNDAPAVTWECVDPRFNYDPGNTLRWGVPVLPDQGVTNGVTIKYWQDQAGCDKEAAMYVANRPLQSVGELGYLAYDAWRTVKLYGAGCQRVFDVFGMGTNDAVATVTHPRRGLVNPNSNETNVLAVVFAGMPLDEYPGQDPCHRLTVAEIEPLVDQIKGRSYTNLADIGRNVTTFPGTATNELQKEACFRNTCGLLSMRQNLFAVIIEAQVASGWGGVIAQNPARQRAVALVWRDPYTGEMFVRSIKWLED